MRITRVFVLLGLAALLAPPTEASRTSVWGSNPHASLTATKSDETGLLSSRASAARPDTSALAAAEAAEPPRFNLGDVVLVGTADANAEHFHLGPLTLVDLNLLRGPPPSYPETRVGGFELLPPFRIGAPPRLSLWSRQACGFSCGEVVSDSREDPWGLAVSVAKNGTIVISDERSPTGGTYRVSREEAEANRALLQNALVEMGGLSPEESDKFVTEHDLGVRTEAGRAQAMGALTSGMTERWLKDAARLEAELGASAALGYGAGKALGAGLRWGMGRLAGTRAGNFLSTELSAAAPESLSIVPEGGWSFPQPAPKIGATFGEAASNNYPATFFRANPDLEGRVVVHHAVERQALRRYPGVVSKAEMHSLENLRGVPKELNADLHLSKIRKEWNRFYRTTPNPTSEQLLMKATEIDRKYGTLFRPPVTHD